MDNPINTPENPEAIRSEIDETRRRMDETINQLSDRLRGRHLLDEVIGFFRSRQGTDSPQVTQQVTERASAAWNSVSGSVKAHPIPALMIGAGVAWLIYETTRGSRSNAQAYEKDLERTDYGTADYSDESAYGAVSFEYAAGATAAGGLESELVRDDMGRIDSGASSGIYEDDDFAEGEAGRGQSGRVSRAKEYASETAGQLAERARSSANTLRERTAMLQARAKEMYQYRKQQIATTVDQHPIEVGLGVLALGVVAGLALPTNRRVSDMVRPTADRLKQQAREAGQDLVQRGKHVVAAATDTLKQEVQAQGLTPAGLREKAANVVARTKEAAAQTAHEEGLTPGQVVDTVKERSRTGAQPAGSAPAM